MYKQRSDVLDPGTPSTLQPSQKKTPNRSRLQSTAPSDWTGPRRASPLPLPAGLDYVVRRLQSTVQDGPWGTLVLTVRRQRGSSLSIVASVAENAALPLWMRTRLILRYSYLTPLITMSIQSRHLSDETP
jgi:hypothetical protein